MLFLSAILFANPDSFGNFGHFLKTLTTLTSQFAENNWTLEFNFDFTKEEKGDIFLFWHENLNVLFDKRLSSQNKVIMNSVVFLAVHSFIHPILEQNINDAYEHKWSRRARRKWKRLRKCAAKPWIPPSNIIMMSSSKKKILLQE